MPLAVRDPDSFGGNLDRVGWPLVDQVNFNQAAVVREVDSAKIVWFVDPGDNRTHLVGRLDPG